MMTKELSKRIARRRTPAGRWADAQEHGTAPATTFAGDDPTTIDGRVCIPVTDAVGPRLRDSFRLRGAWYIPARATDFAYRDYNGRAVYAAATDMAYFKALAIL